jgi:hypothetical protein
VKRKVKKDEEEDKDTKKPRQDWEWACDICGEEPATVTNRFGQRLCGTCSPKNGDE